MATKIVTKNSSTASAVPTASDLVQGELAVNVADKRLFTEDNAGAIVELGTNPSTIDINAGTIDGTTVGASSASTGAFTTLTATGIDVTGTATMDGLTVDASNSTFNGAVGITSAAGAGISEGLLIDYSTNLARFLTYDSSTGSELAMYTQPSGGSTKQRFRINSDGDISFYEDTGTTPKFFWDASAESLGIGTSSPVRPLSVKASQEQLTLSEGDARGATFDYRSSTGNLNIATNGTNARTNPQFTLDLNGNVGIGTSSPADNLDISLNNNTGAVVGVQIHNTNAGTTSNFAGIITTAVNGTVGMRVQAASVAGLSAATFGSTTSHPARFVTADVERMRIDASGNVGIGTSSPNAVADLHVADTSDARIWLDATSADTMELYSGTGVGMFNRSNSYLMLGTNNTERMRIDSSGNLYCSGGSGGTILTLTASSGTTSGDIGRIRFGNNDIDSNLVNIVGYQDGATNSGGLKFETQPAGGATVERMRIDSNGNLLVGTTAIPNGTSVYGSALAWDNYDRRVLVQATSTTIDRGLQLFYNPNGLVGSINVVGSSTSYNTSSDQRLKENITNADDAGSKIDSIQVRQYDWKADGSHQDYGMIAQELQAVAPEAVSGDAASEEMMGVDYSKLVPMMLKEIQSLRNRVAQLEE